MMAKLTLSMDGMQLREIPLDKERMTIGRKPNNDIQIDNLAISGEHAAIVSILNDAFLEDLGSTNGTQVNGQPVKKHFLQNGDVIELGKYRLKYHKEPNQQTSPADFEKTMIIRPARPADPADEKTTMVDAQVGAAAERQHPSAAPAVKAGAAGAASSSQSPPVPPRAAIQILAGVNAGRELELTKTLSTLGKPGVQVAVITRRPHGYFITHVEGAIFPSVNGKLLDAQAHPLLDHDIIELAGTKMEFFLKG